MTVADQEFTRKITEIREALLETFGMPVWRTPYPPVDELVSTILSQNTNDINRDKAFDTLKASFPSWEAVMVANPVEVIEAVRIAGLANQKGPRIQQALMEISEHTGGNLDLAFLRDLPVEEARAWLMNIKGVGPKTAAIVLLFSMGIPAFPVDTHIYRVTGRLGLRPMKLNRKQTHVYLEERTPPEFFYDLHLNIIRLGREVCGARKWECDRCPVESLCPFENKNLSSGE
ncbi:endonuclease III [Chloroflexota bacterium]|nr:endonuclease III [Chloroflexota bacterium]